MVEPGEDFELPQLTVPLPYEGADRADDEKEPFLHSVTSKTPWCLYSVMVHVFIIAVIGMVSLMNEETENQARTQLEATMDPIQTTEFIQPAALHMDRNEPNVQRMIGDGEVPVDLGTPYSFYKDSAQRIATVLRLVLNQYKNRR